MTCVTPKTTLIVELVDVIPDGRNHGDAYLTRIQIGVIVTVITRHLQRLFEGVVFRFLNSMENELEKDIRLQIILVK